MIIDGLIQIFAYLLLLSFAGFVVYGLIQFWDWTQRRYWTRENRRNATWGRRWNP